jgi:hypothetical protein
MMVAERQARAYSAHGVSGPTAWWGNLILEIADCDRCTPLKISEGWAETTACGVAWVEGRNIDTGRDACVSNSKDNNEGGGQEIKGRETIRSVGVRGRETGAQREYLIRKDVWRFGARGMTRRIRGKRTHAIMTGDHLELGLDCWGWCF